jgi:hypothetical protein
MIRISVGMEDVEDIIWDLNQALGGAAGDMTAGAAGNSTARGRQ